MISFSIWQMVMWCITFLGDPFVNLLVSFLYFFFFFLWFSSLFPCFYLFVFLVHFFFVMFLLFVLFSYYIFYYTSLFMFMFLYLLLVPSESLYHWRSCSQWLIFFFFKYTASILFLICAYLINIFCHFQLIHKKK